MLLVGVVTYFSWVVVTCCSVCLFICCWLGLLMVSCGCFVLLGFDFDFGRFAMFVASGWLYLGFG